MENTDSYDTDTMEKVDAAIQRNKAKSGARDSKKVLKEFESGKVRCPIVLMMEDGSTVLIAGNTRLMVARRLQVVPKIVLLKSDW